MISKPFGARSSTIAKQSFGPTTRIRSTIISPPEQHDNFTFLFAERKISAARGIGPCRQFLSTTGVLDGVVGASRGKDRGTCCHGPTHRRFHHRWRRIGGLGARQPPHGERP